MMRIEALASRRIDQLSGGQRQRVALARAIAPQPRVLLLDEPLTALDAKLRDDLRLEIDRLLRSLRITAVYVTHDQAEAMALGDRIAVMSHGRIAQIGTPHEIYFSPADAFVADFIGAMNRLEGQAEDGDREVNLLACHVLHCPLYAPGNVTPGPRLADPLLNDRSTRSPLPLGAGGSTVMFRPEDLRLVDPAQAQFSGQVISSFFLGDHTRLVIDAQGVQLVARVQDRRVFRPGDAVHGCVDAGAVLALPSALT